MIDMMDENYLAKKYGLTKTHSEVLKLKPLLNGGSALDLGSGRGRNTFYLNSIGFQVDAVDTASEQIDILNDIRNKEGFEGITAKIYDINLADIKKSYDLIISTVVFQHLLRDRVPGIIQNIQASTNIGGLNMIVAPMSTVDLPCPIDFSFSFSENELREYYKDWEILDYREDLGEFHKLDENGDRHKSYFVTILAKNYLSYSLTN